MTTNKSRFVAEKIILDFKWHESKGQRWDGGFECSCGALFDSMVHLFEHCKLMNPDYADRDRIKLLELLRQHKDWSGLCSIIGYRTTTGGFFDRKSVKYSPKWIEYIYVDLIIIPGRLLDAACEWFGCEEK